MSNENLTNISDEFSYLVRDYASIINWFTRKLSHLTTKWTDLSITEPDTLMLSYIAYTYDMINYLIDNKYINTMFDETQSISYLSTLYKLVGLELKDYESSELVVNVNNRSNSLLSIRKLDLLQLKSHSTELFTAIENVSVQPGLTSPLTVVRGLPILYQIDKGLILNGMIKLPDSNINRNCIVVTVNGDDLEQVEYALLDSRNNVFSVGQYGDNRTYVRLSPSTYRKSNSIVVKYVLNDDYALSVGSELILMNDPEGSYSITSTTTGDVNLITINEMKSSFYNHLDDIYTIYNNHYNTDNLIMGRIDYLRLNSVNNNILESGTVNYTTGELYLSLNRVPSSSIAVTYSYNTKLPNEQDTVMTVTDYIAVTEYISTVKVTSLPSGININVFSVIIKAEDNIIIDISPGMLYSVHSTNNLYFDYSTVDDNVVSDILFTGSVDYVSASIIINFNYLPYYTARIYYEYTLDSKQYESEILYDFISLTNSLLLNDIPGVNIVPGSVKIYIGDTIIGDNSEGILYTIQSDESIFIDNVSSHLVIDETSANVHLSKLRIRYINVVADVYLKATDMSLEDIDNSIKNKLNEYYKKGAYPPGSTISRIQLLIRLENSNDNIDYAIIREPYSDISINPDELPVMGTITLNYERSE